MKLVVGLGNPGREYALQRHNVGFRVVDQLAKRWTTTGEREKFRSLCGEATVGAEKIILIKPQTFMNLSGEAVVEAKQFYKLADDEIIVIHDDLDLELGRLKYDFDRGSGGHNGIASIIDLLGTKAFYRLRLGIGRPSGEDPAAFVLMPFLKAEEEQVQTLVQDGAQSIEEFIVHGLKYVQQKYH